jgi:hypothetical protein
MSEREVWSKLERMADEMFTAHFIVAYCIENHPFGLKKP